MKTAHEALRFPSSTQELLCSCVSIRLNFQISNSITRLTVKKHNEYKRGHLQNVNVQNGLSVNAGDVGVVSYDL